jgi:GAF domain-containing protein
MMVLLAARAGLSASVGQAAIKVPDGGLAAGSPGECRSHRCGHVPTMPTNWEPSMGTARNATQQQLFELVHHARTTLGMPVAFLTRMDATTQTPEVVDSKIPFLFQEGYQQQRDQTLCQAAIDGRVPPVMGDQTKHKMAMQLPAARFPRLRSFVTVPVHLSDGSLYGSFCAAGVTANDDLRARDAELMSLLARAAAVIVEPEVVARRQTAEIEDRYAPVLNGGGPQVVYQPIVDLRTRRRVGSEALSRFPRAWGKAPDVCFAEAFQAGFGEKLEFLTLRRAGSGNFAMLTATSPCSAAPKTWRPT